MRKYQIVKNIQSPIFEGFVPIQEQELDKIINHSADLVFCNILEYASQSDGISILKKLFEKIKLGGNIVIELDDIKKICLDFVDNKISTDTFFTFVSNKHRVLSIDSILSLLDSQFFKITNRHDKENYIYSITIQRINI